MTENQKSQMKKEMRYLERYKIKTEVPPCNSHINIVCTKKKVNRFDVAFLVQIREVNRIPAYQKF